MSTQLAKKEMPSILTHAENLIMQGDLSRLSPDQRMAYYRHRCDTLGLDPMSRPFDYITLNGKLVLYANRGGVEQVRRNNNVSVIVTDKVLESDVYTVFVQASTPEGRKEDDCGAVNVKGLTGENLANAKMKAMTKAKRRATIAICGLGMLDETEVETIPNAKTVRAEVVPAIVEAPTIDREKVKQSFDKHADKKDESFEVASQTSLKVMEVNGDTTIPSGMHAGKKFSALSKKEWFEYAAKIDNALSDPQFPQDKRDEALCLLKLIEAYI